MLKFGMGFTLAAALSLVTMLGTQAAGGAINAAQPVATTPQLRSEPARPLDFHSVPATEARVTVAVLDITPPQAHASSKRRIKAHRHASRHRKERALQFSEGAQGNFRSMIAEHAAAAGVPVALADAVVRIESRYNPRATNGSAMGLMQIQPRTARGMGFTGAPAALLQPEVNLRFGMKYLAAAYRDSHGDTCQTVTRYQSGHYSGRINHAYCAKAKAIMASR